MNPSSTPKILIDFDASSEKLMVSCPVWANEFVKAFPSRRWVKSKTAWAVPVIKRNVEYARQLAQMAGVTVTPAAVEVMNRHDKAVESMDTGADFPAWYPFKTQPLHHQRKAINKAYPLKAFALFMDMQTGKSKTAIDLACAHRMEGHLDAVLILVKLSLRRNWLKELNKHAPIPFSFFLPDTDDQRRFDMWLQRPHDFKVMAAGWESLSAGRMAEMCKKFVHTQGKVLVIGDETTYIGGHNAERSKQACEIGQQAEFRYALTGTPIYDAPLNLYMQFEFLDPNIIGIGDYYAFRNRYAVMGGYVPKEGPMKGKPLKVIGYQNIEELVETVAPYTYQVRKNEAYPDLPPKRYEERYVQLTKQQRTIYDQIRKEESFTVRGRSEVVLKNVLEVMLRLHQVAGGYAVDPREIRRKNLVTGEDKVKVVYDPVELIPPKSNPKVQEVMSIIEEARQKQGLIWCVYRPEIEAVKWALRHMGIKFSQLHGGIDEASGERQREVSKFNDGTNQWLVGNAATGGMGYTMMESEVNVFYNNTFKLIDRLQAEDRSYGHGQTKSGIWIDILAEKTVDITFMKALEQKVDVAEFVRGRLSEAIKLMEGDV